MFSSNLRNFVSRLPCFFFPAWKTIQRHFGLRGYRLIRICESETRYRKAQSNGPRWNNLAYFLGRLRTVMIIWYPFLKNRIHNATWQPIGAVPNYSLSFHGHEPILPALSGSVMWGHSELVPFAYGQVRFGEGHRGETLTIQQESQQQKQCRVVGWEVKKAKHRETPWASLLHLQNQTYCLISSFGTD